ncbi:MAG: gluconokinase [candidate division KSB1 bacterium]|nr:gluconokinase [candidate division KSB1 bacterium]MDZ7368675.1 gluconokinase [candidate division KSB1 bacterium]MDZ7406490.1 gluconokinase [candidate division KSB1 bacterium]
MIIILMGVSGAGKTVIGRLLAEALGWPFYDGDDFHPEANIKKMRSGIPLDDDDRDLWLATLRRLIEQQLQNGANAILACSALKQRYRDRLQQGRPEEIRFVYLKGEFALIQQRLQERRDHFMNPNLLQSQFETLEEPEGVLTVDVMQEPTVIVDLIKRGLS